MQKELEAKIIDAEGKKLGRVASMAAASLMGKTRTDFQRNAVPIGVVRIVNVGKADISVKKMDTVVYTSYSGYPGGLKKRAMKEVVAKKGRTELFRKAVKGMLPKNKLQAQMMKNLEILE